MGIKYSSTLWEVKLSDFYFIYIGEDNEEFSIMDMLTEQDIFTNASFISQNPVGNLNSYNSAKEWVEAIKAKNIKYILIFADLKKPEYFYELSDLCKEIGYPKDKIAIIAVNDLELLYGKMPVEYNKFLDTNNVIGPFWEVGDQPLPEQLKHVLFNQAINYKNPTLKTLITELDWEFLLKYYKRMR